MKPHSGNSLQTIRAKLRNPAPFQGMPGEFVRLDGSPVAPGPGASAASPLGTYAESSTPPLLTASKQAEARADRYELQGYARDLLLARGKALGLEHAGNFHKTAKCLYTPFDRAV